MIPSLPSSYSTVSAEALLQQVLVDYSIDTPERCLFWERRTNDTYVVHCADAKYALRVYRHEIYPRDAMEFEVEGLLYLRSQGFDVAYPIPRKSGGYLTEIAAAEGSRYAMLTSFAEGKCLEYKAADDARWMGASVARMHQASLGFKSSYVRARIDLRTLVDESIAAMEPHVLHRPRDLDFVRHVGQLASDAVRRVPESELDIGFCHGDLHGSNAHIHEGVITHFDFEECGYGYRAYDIATFRWGTRLDGAEELLWPAFQAGYESVREIGAADLGLMQHFILIRHIWLIGFHMRNAGDFGADLTSDGYIDRQWKRLRELKDACGDS